MPQTYFTTFNSSIYVERYGFKNWGELLTNQLLRPYATVFSNGQRVKSTKIWNQSQNNVQVLQPHVISTGSSTSQIHGATYTNLGASANNTNSPAAAPSVTEYSVVRCAS